MPRAFDSCLFDPTMAFAKHLANVRLRARVCMCIVRQCGRPTQDSRAAGIARLCCQEESRGLEVCRQPCPFDADSQRRKHRQVAQVRPRIASLCCTLPCRPLRSLQGHALRVRIRIFQKLIVGSLFCLGARCVTSGLEPTWRGPSEESKNQVHLAEKYP